MTLALAILLIVALVGFVYFILEAKSTGDWSTIKSMSAEFVSVAAALSIGIWISFGERTYERNGEARALVFGAGLQANSIVAELEGQTSLLRWDVASIQGSAFPQPSLQSPNVIETLISSSTFYEFYQEDAKRIVKAYGDLKGSLTPTISSRCDLPKLFLTQIVTTEDPTKLNRWMYHASDYFPSAPKRENELKTISFLKEKIICVFSSFSDQLALAQKLAHAICGVHKGEADIPEHCSTYMAEYSDFEWSTESFFEKYRDTPIYVEVRRSWSEVNDRFKELNKGE